MDTNQIKLIEKLSELFLDKSVIEKEIATYSESEIENINPYEGKKERFYKIEGIIDSCDTELDAYAVHWLFDGLEFKALEMIKALTMLVQTVDPDRIEEQIPNLAGMPSYLVKQANDALDDRTRMRSSNAGKVNDERYHKPIRDEILLRLHKWYEREGDYKNRNSEEFKEHVESKVGAGKRTIESCMSKERQKLVFNEFKRWNDDKQLYNNEKEFIRLLAKKTRTKRTTVIRNDLVKAKEE